MSLLKKAMANVFGIGGTKVDTIISTKSTFPGGKIDGVVNIYGGQVEQEIKNAYIDIKTNYEKEYDDKTTNVEAVVQRFVLEINKTIKCDENISIPFSFKLDLDCPISQGKSTIWISTRLDIGNAIDSLDGDNITIKSNSEMDTIFKAIESLGFRLKSTKNIYDNHRLSKNNYIQEFEYIPMSGSFRGKLDELEIVILSHNNGLRIVLEVDRKVRGLGSLVAEKLSLDENLVKIDFTYSDLQNSQFIAKELMNLIKRYS